MLTSTTSATATPTTTTPTTTVTTSVTTTPIVAAFECVANYGTCFPGGTSCSDDVPKLNAILLATGPTVAGTLTCKMLNGVKNLADQASTTSCAETATAVENVIAEFTEPGGRAEDVGSVFNT